MVPQRWWMPVLLLVGIGLGLLSPRPSIDLSEVVAANRVTWRCLPLTLDVDLRIHNASSGEVAATLTRFSANGVLQQGEVTIDLTANATESRGVQGASMIKVRGPSPVLVAGYEADTDSQIACYKKTTR